MIIQDDFLSNYPEFREHLDVICYNGVTNPVDGVFYPGVSIQIPENVSSEVHSNIEHLEGETVTINAMFLRLSLEGVEAPHQAHTDAVMGQRSLMLYLSRKEDCIGGTSFVTHHNGMDRNPVNEYEEKVWAADTNNPEKWDVTSMCEMAPNRALMFDSGLMHRAEPIGGFGNSPQNGRLVLTAFYDYS